MSAVIVVPMHGKDANPFFECAKNVLSSVYNNDGVIYKAHPVPGSGGVVKFHPAVLAKRGASSDHWEYALKANRYIVISHMGVVDGPILTVPGGIEFLDNQPWAREAGTESLRQMGAIHWATVGRSRSNSVQIILLGCESGEEKIDGKTHERKTTSYGRIVSRYAQSKVWGFANSCPSAIPEFSIAACRSIEGGGHRNDIVPFG